MSYLNSISSLGRIAGALVGGILFAFVPVQGLVGAMMALCIVSLFFVLVFFRYLKPYQEIDTVTLNG